MSNGTDAPLASEEDMARQGGQIKRERHGRSVSEQQTCGFEGGKPRGVSFGKCIPRTSFASPGENENRKIAVEKFQDYPLLNPFDTLQTDAGPASLGRCKTKFGDLS